MLQEGPSTTSIAQSPASLSRSPPPPSRCSRVGAGLATTTGKYIAGDKQVVLVFGIADAVRVDGKDGLRLGEARGIVDLTDARLSATFSEVEAAARPSTSETNLVKLRPPPVVILTALWRRGP